MSKYLAAALKSLRTPLCEGRGIKVFRLEENDGPKYPDIDVQLTGNDGNAYAIMGAVSQALRRAGVSKEEIDQYTKESMSGDYDNLLRTAMKWVNVG